MEDLDTIHLQHIRVLGNDHPDLALALHNLAHDLESEGDYARGDLVSMAEDARAAAKALTDRNEIDAGRIIYLGLGSRAVSCGGKSRRKEDRLIYFSISTLHRIGFALILILR